MNCTSHTHTNARTNNPRALKIFLQKLGVRLNPSNPHWLRACTGHASRMFRKSRTPPPPLYTGLIYKQVNQLSPPPPPTSLLNLIPASLFSSLLPYCCTPPLSTIHRAKSKGAQCPPKLSECDDRYSCISNVMSTAMARKKF